MSKRFLSILLITVAVLLLCISVAAQVAKPFNMERITFKGSKRFTQEPAAGDCCHEGGRRVFGAGLEKFGKPVVELRHVYAGELSLQPYLGGV